MNYNMIEPLHFYSYHEFVIFSSQAKELFPIRGYREKARSDALHQYQKPDTNQSSYLISYNHKCLLFLSFERKGNVAVVRNCLYQPKHSHASVSLSEWLERLDGIFRYFNITCYHMHLKNVLADSERLFDEVVNDTEGVVCLRHSSSTKTAMVLGGGGARGAYQLGVWQYFRENKLTYDIVTGASVGALNGALMVQNDWEKAQAMWHQIETTDVFDISMLPAEEMTDISTLLDGMKTMATKAVLNQGISTEPLYQYVKGLLNHKRLTCGKPSLWLTATHLLTMQERVVHLNACDSEKRVDWLLASASFFPALAPHQIDGEYYVDGGYRNNIPVDLAVKEGANQLFVIDVKGPGVTKKYDVPLTITPIVLKSPWLLGNMLLFDTRRAKWNQQLGYLELKRVIEKKAGFWYTFDVEVLSEEYLQINRELVRKIKTFIPVERLSSKKMHIVYERLRIVYMSKVSAYNLGWVILELTGRLYGLDPTTYYSVESFCQMLLARLSQETSRNAPAGLYSLPEWLTHYRQKKSAMSEEAQVARWLTRFRQENWQKEWLEMGLLIQSDTFLIACLVWSLQ
ncbi:patatin-like phospholipase family protein [Vagococcus lutrae]|uniref:patatin-like phospholipase family protein n=1 Tax=Vagococcus lutrae TaxID=81947 RepID=UPI00200EAE96|nr:patatin-like phospholipase family protein [Vagococcus lutrae]UQF12443.1 patatin-like phospholipase family protein [Vagococcus lutrae]